MSLETKIKELMEAKRAKQLAEAEAGKSNDGEGMNAHKQGDSQASAYAEVDPFTGGVINSLWISHNDYWQTAMPIVLICLSLY
jgi:hypothetical protein